MRLEVNETAAGIVAPSKEFCKVKGCNGLRFKSDRPHAFCKKHSGLKNEMSKKKFRAFISSNEVVVPEVVLVLSKKTGPTSKAAKWRVIKNKLLNNEGVNHA